MATARLTEKYREEVVPGLMKRFGYRNPMMVPRLSKVVINIGLSEAKDDIKILEGAMKELAAIAGQKPKITRSKKSIANFKLRAGQPIGCKVTLRGNRMYEFLDRFITLAAPRMRDFRGLPSDSFDGRGNYTFGLEEQMVFPEIDYDKVEMVKGMDVTIVTTADVDEEAFELLKLMGMPFRR
ncbi:MAG: 50S ribosomal protein L5 [Candidatus Eisenbacteria bacterium]|nr:50S ribosomal protein L5 [Candidatus Eisenbacteria bacterium]